MGTFSFMYICYFDQSNRDVDQVHDMMDDIAEQQDVAKEISDAISNPVAFGNDIDEDELEKELEELEQEELDKELLGVGPSATDELPDVPVDELQEKAKAKKKGSRHFCFSISII